MQISSLRRLAVAATVVTMFVGGVATSARADEDGGCSEPPDDPSGGVVCENVESTQGMVDAMSCFVTGKGVFSPCGAGGEPEPTPTPEPTPNFVVTTEQDLPDPVPGDGACGVAGIGCSLRAAIEEANASLAADTIHFNLPPVATTISVLSALPQISSPVTIDATTQPGFAGEPLVTVDGSRTKPAVGLHLIGGNSVVRGIAVVGFGTAQISIDGSGGHTLTGNRIGPSAGTFSGNATHDGIVVTSAANVIGGAETNAGNRVAGYRAAIALRGSGARGNIVSGNTIGAPMDLARSNGTGIEVDDAPGNLIGGTTPRAENVIVRSFSGIRLIGEGASANVVQGNTIGADSHIGAFGNNVAGIEVVRAPNNIIGGPEPGAGNVVIGNGSGISIGGTPADGNVIQGNFIGTDRSGEVEIGNDTGIAISNASNTVIGGDDEAANMIKNNAAGITIRSVTGNPTETRIEGNVIASNGTGVWVFGGTTGVTVTRNSFSGNGGLAIDLTTCPDFFFCFDSGVSLNDSGDPDGGPNEGQNFPWLDSASTDAAGSSISGMLDSVPSSTFALEFFWNASCDDSGHGEAEHLIATSTVTTDALGITPFTVTGLPAPIGSEITATATDEDGNTSELSACVTAEAAPDPAPTPTPTATPTPTGSPSPSPSTTPPGKAKGRGRGPR